MMMTALLLRLPRITLSPLGTHPSEMALGRHHEQTDSARDRASVERHLAACAHCRRWLAWRRSLSATARALGGQSAVAGAPVEHVAATEQRSGAARLVIGLAAAAAIVATFIAMPARHDAIAGAAEGSLEIAPSLPRSGDTISVSYRPNAALASAPVLALRAVFHPADDTKPWTRPTITVAWLMRDGRGVYHGRFVFPDSVVYARLAVEDSSGARVDARGGLAWEVLAHDSAGRVRMTAVRTRGLSVPPDEWERSRAIALEATRVLPDHPSGWLVATEQTLQLTPAAKRDSFLTSMRPVVARLDTVLARETTHEPWAMLDLATLAELAHEDSMAQRWRARLVHEAPRSRAAYSIRVTAIAPPRVAPAAQLDSLATWWRADPDSISLFAGMALSIALRSGDSAATVQWANRMSAGDAQTAAAVARALVESPKLAADGIRLSTGIAPLADRDRPLGITVTEWRRQQDRARRDIDGIIGEGLAAQGKWHDARTALEHATSAGWNGRAYKLLGDARLALGDTVGAIAAFADAAVDPVAGRSLATALSSRLGRRVADDRWRALTDSARHLMHARVLDATIATPLAGAPHLADSVGVRRALSDVSLGRLTFVAFVNRECGPSFQDLSSVERLSQAVRGLPVSFIVVTRESPNASLRAFMREQRLTFPVWHDVDGEMASALVAHSTPTYFVIDGSGIVRWRGHRAADASPIIDALLDR
jgi:hypothetical protein